MKKIFLILTAAVLCACQEKAEDTVPALADPSGLKIEQTDPTTVRLAWTDNADGEKGYRVYLRDKNDPANVAPLTTLDADSESFSFENLVTGEVYHFGVQAVSEDFNLHSQVVYVNDYKVLTLEELWEQGTVRRIEAPTQLAVEQVGQAMNATLTWKDNASDETGYKVYFRKESAESFTKAAATLDKDVTSYTFTNLSGGVPYVFGVQALGAAEVNASEIVTVTLTLEDYARIPSVTDVKTSYAYIAVSYKVQKLSGSNPEHGVCFSENGTPSVDDIKVLGPNIVSDTEILQVVPNAYLEADREYQMSVFVKDGDSYLYSEPQTVKLEAQPATPELVWEKQTYDGLPADVEIYKTVSPLNGRNFNAWYAVADPSKVDFRVLNTPTGKANCKTVAYQAENADGDCLVLINGGVFGNYHIGVIHVDGKPQEWVDSVYDKYWNPNSDGTLWPITRPIIGVDNQGKAAAYWTASPSYGTYYYYDRPLPTVPGEAKYAAASATFPVESVEWDAYNALSTGPMILYDSKCCVDHAKAPSGAYMTNYECWALDIYEGNPDRTVVGVTSDGKIVLFICDGRIDASKGATHEEAAMIMKSIGCVHAMNLDGGGSTGMWVKGSGMINYMDGSWRAVKSTLGFFSK